MPATASSSSPGPESVAALLAEQEHAARARRARARLDIIATSVALYAANVLLLALAAQLGAIERRHVVVYAVAVALVVLTTALLVQFHARVVSSGRGFTLMQMLAPVLTGFYAIYHLQDASARGAFLLMSLVPLVFGTIGLDTRRYLAVALVYVATFGCALLAIHTFAEARTEWRGDMLQLYALVAAAIEVALVGGYIQRLRMQLRSRTAERDAAFEQVSELKQRDPLTGVPARHAIGAALAALVADATREGYAFAVCLLDVDRLEVINADCGQQVGDALLQRVAERAAQGIRSRDHFGRWGGDQFLLLMPGTALDGALIIADRIRQDVADLMLDDLAVGLSATVSMGVAQLKPGESVASLLGRAERACRKAKAEGRNRVRQDVPTGTALRLVAGER